MMNKHLKHATRNDRWVSFLSRPLELSFLQLMAVFGPVVRIPFIGVVVSEGAVLRSVLMDTQHFSKTAPGGTSDLWDPILRGPGLLNMSGVDHLALKRKLTPLFNGKALDEMVGTAIRLSARELAESISSGEKVDVVAHVELMAARVMCTLSGYDLDATDERELLTQLDRARGLLRFVKLTRKELRPHEVTIAISELENIHVRISEAFERNQVSTIPYLLKQNRFSKSEVISIISALIIAGTETVISHLPRFIQLLVTGQVISNGGMDDLDLDELIHEGLRVTVPTPVMIRGVTAPTKIGKVSVKPGDRILLATTLACRRAGDFDPIRPMPKELRNLWFGAGVHFCIGMPLAQREILEVTQELFRLCSGRKITIVEARIRKGTLTAGYSRLVVQCEPF
jgi:cytochrome P450